MSSIHLSPAYLHPVTAASTALEFLSTTLHPIGGAVAAIVVLTLLVRLALHPLVRAAVRGERARAALAPRVAELRRTHAGNVTALGTELTALYRGAGISPFAGALPLLAQAPFFLVLYQAFRRSAGPVGGAHLWGVPLHARLFAGGGALGVHVAVFAVLLLVLGALAWGNARRAGYVTRAAGAPAPTGAMTAVLRFAPYALLVSGLVLPLATGIYLVTTTAWSLAENTVLRRGLA